MRAELHADGGVRSASEEFFRSPGFLEAEGVTHTLQVGPSLIPVVVREIPGSGGLADAVSPYGYPGAATEPGGVPPDPAAVDWSRTGLVSVFVRDRVGDPPALGTGTERSSLQIHDPSLGRRVRPRLAEQVRRNRREGWEIRTCAGPDAAAEDRAAFHSLYTETMRRTDAAPRYLYERAYFDAILGEPRTWLFAAHAGGSRPQAGAIAALSDGVLHYYLGGTADAALEASPFKNVVVAMLDLADELEVPLNLGGGVSAGDGLERFKRGFANAERAFRTHEVVCDGDAYDRLAGPRQAAGFFPAYRAPQAER